ncbi:hypothetical protein ASU31_10520 [Pedobacter ginsenosidimutans]|uniref:ATPase AAA-type core domain-containing protein n=1 Tax=Pedobacter ginsenosidimutans TaxID=687842 RepID=A0A0T5VQ24_9SPHI|nr:AAA family ATPase [Pedobacter ginsenosidimutans]KRT15936.1 hypothetical protein ASU31_10520 [Pedobacter ginsenosidimutans]
MQFYKKGFKEPLTIKNIYPCIAFVKDSWDDDGFTILFDAFYYTSYSDFKPVGRIKILDRNTKSTLLNESFEYLNQDQCSLGQNLEFYETLKRLVPNGFIEILECLNDIAWTGGLAFDFQDVDGYNNALLRFTSAQRAFQEARSMLINDVRKVHENLNFTYRTLLSGAEAEHEAHFNFIKSDDLPYRINVIIGKNGTGKTQYLGRMIDDISGSRKVQRLPFSPYIPLFNKFITISYSLFDDFPKPPETTVFNYKFIGLRGENDIVISDQHLALKLQEALLKIVELDRSEEWYDILNRIIPLQSLQLNSGNELTNSWIKEFHYFRRERRLSSGQSILFFVLTELIAHITEESLVIFDEPETHLHPSAIAQLIKSFSEILEAYKSFAIISTHSPIIIQDVPAKYINVFDRIDNTPIVRKLHLESFGENISVLTDSVFQTVDVKELYKTQFEKLINQQLMSEDQINALFDNKLSFNAMLYLTSLFQNNSNEES